MVNIRELLMNEQILMSSISGLPGNPGLEGQKGERGIKDFPYFSAINYSVFY